MDIAKLKCGSWFTPLRSKKERILLPILLIALVATGSFLGILEDLLTGDPLVQADQWVYHLLQGLRTPLADHLLIAVTELGDSAVNSAIVVSLLSVLLLRRQFFAAGFWLFSIGGGAGLVQLLKWSLQRPRPIEIYNGISSWSFPSGHATMSALVYGSLAILVVRGFNSRWRWFPFATAISLSLLVAFSRVYLGAHWLSDVLGGLSLGWAWVTLLGFFYLSRRPAQVPVRPLILASLFALLLAGSWNIQNHHTQDMNRYRAHDSSPSLSAES